MQRTAGAEAGLQCLNPDTMPTAFAGAGHNYLGAGEPNERKNENLTPLNRLYSFSAMEPSQNSE